MAKKALRKDLWMEICRNRGRFFSIVLIVALGVAFFSGLRASEYDMRYTADAFTDTYHLMDIRVIGTLGLTDEDVRALAAIDGVREAEASKMQYVLTEREDVDYVLELTAAPEKMNQIQVIEGRMPKWPDECLVDYALAKRGFEIGDTIVLKPDGDQDLSESFSQTEFEITGYGEVPLYIGMERGSATVGNGEVSGFVIVEPEVFKADYYTQIFLRVKGAEGKTAFTDEYYETVDSVLAAVKEIRGARCEARFAQIYAEAEEPLLEAEAEYADAKAEAEQELADARTELDDGWAEAADGEETIRENEIELADAKEELLTLREELLSTKSDLLTQKSELYVTKSDLLTQQEELAATKTDLEEKQSEALDMKADLEAQRAELVTTRADVESQRAELATLKADLEAQRAELVTTKASVETKRAELAALKTDLEAQRAGLVTTKVQLEEQRAEAAAAKIELETQRASLAATKTELETQRIGLVTMKTEFEAQQMELTAAKAEAEAMRAELIGAGVQPDDANLIEIDNRIVQLDAGLAELAAGLAGVDAGLAQIDANLPQVDAGLAQIDANLPTVNAGIAQIDANLPLVNNGIAEIDANLPQINSGIAEIDANLPVIHDGLAQIDTNLPQINNGIAEIDTNLPQINDGIAQIDAALTEIEDGLLELEDGLVQVEDGLVQLEDGLAELEDGLVQLTDGLAEVGSGLIEVNDGLDEVASGEIELEDAKAELADAKVKLEDGEIEYEDGKAEAEAELTDARAELDDAWAELAKLEVGEWYVTDRDDLPGYYEFGANAERIGAIGKVFPAIFFLVAALVALTAITRMVEEQRTQIGTYKALGYSKWDITFKYLSYALIATLGGGVIGVLAGEKIFPFVIIVCYRIMYTPMREIVVPYNIEYGLISIGLAVLSTVTATLFACYKELAAQPAVLMRPAAPKAGKRVFLERIGILWRHLSFSQKATFRNLFRYKKRLIMTVFGIGCCCGLMVVGFGLKDSIMNIASIQYDNIQLYDAMVSVEDGISLEETEQIESVLEQDDRLISSAKLMMMSMDAQTEQAIRTVYVVVTEQKDQLDTMMVFRNRNTHKRYEMDEDGAMLSEQLAKALGVEVGDTISIQTGNTVAEVKVTGISENYLMHYVYMTESVYQEAFGKMPDYNMYWLDLTEQGKQEEQKLGQRLMDMDGVLTINYVSANRKSIEKMLSSLHLIVIVLVIAASLLAFVVIYNLNNINISERRRELATLKLLGFYDMEVANYVYRENIYLTLIGAVVGLGMGKLLHSFVINTIEVSQIMFGRIVSVPSYAACIALTVVFSAIVNGVMYFQLRKIDMVESLKSVE